MNIFKLASRFEKKISGMFDDSWHSDQENKEKLEQENQKELNQKILNYIKSFLSQFNYEGIAGGLDESDAARIMKFDRRYSDRTELKVDALYQLDFGGILSLEFIVNINTGKIIPQNVRIVFTGKNLPEIMKNRIKLVTGKNINYHKPTDGWAYDSSIDSKLKPNNSKLIQLVHLMLGQDKKEF